MLYIGIYEEKEYNVDFDVQTVSKSEPPVKYENNSNLNFGEERVKQGGSNGMTVDVYKVIKSEGTIISRTFLYQDVYNSLDKIIEKNMN